MISVYKSSLQDPACGSRVIGYTRHCCVCWSYEYVFWGQPAFKVRGKNLNGVKELRAWWLHKKNETSVGLTVVFLWRYAFYLLTQWVANCILIKGMILMLHLVGTPLLYFCFIAEAAFYSGLAAQSEPVVSITGPFVQLWLLWTWAACPINTMYLLIIFKTSLSVNKGCRCFKRRCGKCGTRRKSVGLLLLTWLNKMLLALCSVVQRHMFLHVCGTQIDGTFATADTLETTQWSCKQKIH